MINPAAFEGVARLLIAVLVLALLGLWTPIVVAYWWVVNRYEVQLEKEQSPKAAAIARHPAGRHRDGVTLRVVCPVCGAHVPVSGIQGPS